jgi:hypothetical protein
MLLHGNPCSPHETAMTHTNTQVSATISTTTKEKLDRFTEELGLKKNFVVEQALLYFNDPAHMVLQDGLSRPRVIMKAPPTIPDDELRSRVIYALFMPAARIARVFGVPLSDLKDLPDGEES